MYCVTMTSVILKRVTFVWTCTYAKISIQKQMPTLSLVLVLARSPQVHSTEAALRSGLWHQEVAAGSLWLCVCV